MTAATWKQGKKMQGCACTHYSAINCAIAQGLATQNCGCPCHRYTQIEVLREAPQTEGGKCK